MRGGESVRVAFQKSPFPPRPDHAIAAQNPGASSDGEVQTLLGDRALQRFAPNLAPDLSRALCSSSLARPAWWSGKTGPGGEGLGWCQESWVLAGLHLSLAALFPFCLSSH